MTTPLECAPAHPSVSPAVRRLSWHLQHRKHLALAEVLVLETIERLGRPLASAEILAYSDLYFWGPEITDKALSRLVRRREVTIGEEWLHPVTSDGRQLEPVRLAVYGLAKWEGGA